MRRRGGCGGGMKPQRGTWRGVLRHSHQAFVMPSPPATPSGWGGDGQNGQMGESKTPGGIMGANAGNRTFYHLAYPSC